MENEQQSQTEAEAEPAAEPVSSIPPPKRIAKRKDAAWYTGAAAGIAAYIGVDPIWVRLAFVVSSFFGGVGLIVYVIAAFLPDATQAEIDAQPIAPRPFNQAWTTKEWYLGDGRWWFIIGIILVACSAAGAWDFGDGFGFLIAAMLAAAGLYFLSDADRVSDVRERIFGGNATPGAHVDSEATASGTTAYAVPPTFRPERDIEAQKLRAEHQAFRKQCRRDRKILESVTFGLMMIVVGTLWILDRADVYDVAASTMFASALLALGVGVLVGAWRGRSYSIILLALILSPVVLVSNAVDGAIEDGIGEKVWRPADVSQVRSEYRFGTGRTELDLTQVRLGEGEVRTLRVQATAGLLNVRLPQGVGYDVDAKVEYGQLDVLNETNDSHGRDKATHLTKAGLGTIVLDAELDNGLIVIDQDNAGENS